MKLQRESSLKEIVSLAWRSPPGRQTRLTSAWWAQGGSSSWCPGQLRRTALAAPLRPPSSPSLRSWRPRPPGPRGAGSLGPWFLSCSRDPVGLASASDRPRLRRVVRRPGCNALREAAGGGVLLAFGSRECRGRCSLGRSSPPSALPGRGLARSPPPPPMAGGRRQSKQISEYFTAGGERTEIRGAGRRRSAQGFVSHGQKCSRTCTCWGHWGSSPSPPTVKTARAKRTFARTSAIPNATSPHALNCISFPAIWGKGDCAVLGAQKHCNFRPGSKGMTTRTGPAGLDHLTDFHPCTVLCWWGPVATKAAEPTQSHWLAVLAWVSDSTSLELSFDICTRGW